MLGIAYGLFRWLGAIITLQPKNSQRLDLKESQLECYLNILAPLPFYSPLSLV
jgi:hypothetical protein